MDTLSHALWGRGLFGYKGRPYWSLFFGALPDLFSFGIYFLFSLIFHPTTMQSGRPNLEDLPNYIFSLYDLTHSILIAFFIIYLVFTFVSKNFAFAMLAWPFHILLDFPFHTAEFFPTPILWPIIDVKFNGISWGNSYVWFSNIAGITILFIYRYKTHRQ